MNKVKGESKAEAGRIGGASRSPRKLAAIAENAKLAGRPRSKNPSRAALIKRAQRAKKK